MAWSSTTTKPFLAQRCLGELSRQELFAGMLETSQLLTLDRFGDLLQWDGSTHLGE